MPVQVNRGVKLFPALETRKFRFVMIHHVVCQLTFGFEVSVIRAYLALELSLIAVSCPMAFQIALASESFTASGTHVGLFSRVRSHVNCETGVALKTFEANFALMRFIVDVHVVT